MDSAWKQLGIWFHVWGNRCTLLLTFLHISILDKLIPPSRRTPYAFDQWCMLFSCSSLYLLFIVRDKIQRYKIQTAANRSDYPVKNGVSQHPDFPFTGHRCPLEGQFVRWSPSSHVFSNIPNHPYAPVDYYNRFFTVLMNSWITIILNLGAIAPDLHWILCCVTMLVTVLHVYFFGSDRA